MEQAQQTITLTLTVNQINTVIGGLGKLPIEVGLDTFNVVQQQIQTQVGQNQAAVPQGPLSDKVLQ